MRNVKYGKCVRCGKTYDAVPDLTNCACGGILDIVYDYDYIKSVLTKEKLARRDNRSMWRYRELLPVEETTPDTPLRVGWSPLYEEPKLAEMLGIKRLWVKDDGQNPTASLKDRASAMAVAKAYEAGAIITGGHTIEGAEPLYGLAVSGFVHPQKVLTNSGAQPGDVLLLTKPLGIGIITTAAKAGLAEKALTERIYRQMATLNRAARDVMVKYPVHSCTDVTGFALLGHSFEMAQGSGMSLHIDALSVPFHMEALEFADMGFIPAGAYRNRTYVEKGILKKCEIPRALEDIFFDPQTSGGLLIAVAEKDAKDCFAALQAEIPNAAQIGYVTELHENYLILE